MTEPITYEYIGFRFRIFWSDIFKTYIAVPLPGQHRAARYNRHCLAAIESWKADGKPGLKKGE